MDLTDVYEPERWGLEEEAIKGLGEALYGFWERYRKCFKTKTRDQSELAYVHMRGQLALHYAPLGFTCIFMKIHHYTVNFQV